MIFHHFEFSFCGFSNSGKTSLIAKLLKKYSENYNVAYIKHDGHSFEMDKKGKDTWLARSNGAGLVSINDSKQRAIISNYERKNIFNSQIYSAYDFALVEGYKKSKLAKALLLDSDGKIFSEIENEESVKAIIYKEKKDLLLIPKNYSHIPTFNRNQIELISEFLMTYFESLFDLTNVNSLILTGGKSKRMGKDKYSLTYHQDKTQLEYLSDLLSKFTKNVFVSCRQDQLIKKEFQHYKTIADRFIDFGPLSGILSAQKYDPNAYWLVIACDLPFVNERTIDKLFSSLKPFKRGFCFKRENRREPLCAIYSPFSYSNLLNMLALDISCPQKFFWNSNVLVNDLDDDKDLLNANYEREFIKFKEELQNEI